METKLVRRDQFNISPQGTVHKPTDAAFTPYPVILSGTMRLVRSATNNPTGTAIAPMTFS